MAAPVVLGALGLAVAYYPMLGSGLRLIQADRGDTRLVMYILEHTYRAMMRDPAHARLWSPPFYHPARHVGAYTENLLGTIPFYAIWRALGVPPDTSTQLWMLTLSTLNFAIAYLAIARVYDCAPLPAALGAFLFAFGSPRLAALGHQQVLPAFYMIVAVWALVAFFAARSPGAVRIWLSLFAAAVCLQIYSSIYGGWFLVFGLALATLWALVLPRARTAVLERARAFPGTIVAVAACAVLVLLPLGRVYLRATHEIGYRDWGEVLGMVPRWQSWGYHGPGNWLYGRFHAFLDANLTNAGEHAIGIGVLTPLLALAGLWTERRRSAVLLLALPAFSAVGLALAIRGHTTWQIVYAALPAAGAIRVVTRIWMIVILPLSVGFALFWRRALAARHGWLALPLLAFCLVEQGRYQPSYDKLADREWIALVARHVGPECRAFFFSPLGGVATPIEYHLDAMLANLENDVPTVNGYGGGLPRGWRLWDNIIHGPKSERAMADALERWLRRSPRHAVPVCWVKLETPDVGLDAEPGRMRVPRTMRAGRPYRVAVTMHNTGRTGWTAEQLDRFGIDVPDAPWAGTRVPVDGAIPAGETARFAFEVRAPATPGVYMFRGRMLREGVTWFGAPSEVVFVRVRGARSDSRKPPSRSATTAGP